MPSRTPMLLRNVYRKCNPTIHDWLIVKFLGVTRTYPQILDVQILFTFANGVPVP